jgi:hypothetical protein
LQGFQAINILVISWLNICRQFFFVFRGAANLGIYSADQIGAARRADLVAWLQAHGHNLKREGRNWRLPGFGGLLIQGNHFKHFSSGTGGGIASTSSSTSSAWLF